MLKISVLWPLNLSRNSSNAAGSQVITKRLIRKSFQRKLFADLDINGRTIHCKRPSEIFQTAFPYHWPNCGFNLSANPTSAPLPVRQQCISHPPTRPNQSICNARCKTDGICFLESMPRAVGSWDILQLRFQSFYSFRQIKHQTIHLPLSCQTAGQTAKKRFSLSPSNCFDRM